MMTNATIANLKAGDSFVHPEKKKTYSVKMSISEHDVAGWLTELWAFDRDGLGYPLSQEVQSLEIVLLPNLKVLREALSDED